VLTVYSSFSGASPFLFHSAFSSLDHMCHFQENKTPNAHCHETHGADALLSYLARNAPYAYKHLAQYQCDIRLTPTRVRSISLAFFCRSKNIAAAALLGVAYLALRANNPQFQRYNLLATARQTSSLRISNGWIVCAAAAPRLIYNDAIGRPSAPLSLYSPRKVVTLSQNSWADMVGGGGGWQICLATDNAHAYCHASYATAVRAAPHALRRAKASRYCSRTQRGHKRGRW